MKFVGRQAIVDGDFNIIGYELLYRDSEEKNTANVVDNTKATASVLVNLLMDIGIERLVGSKLCFINVNEDVIYSSYLCGLPRKGGTVIEILENTKLNDDILERIMFLRDQGFKIALDDVVNIKDIEPLISLASYIKYDIRIGEKANLEDIIKVAKHHNIKLIAEKVETKEEFEYYKSIGFDYFQGYFIEKPVILKSEYEAKPIKPVLLHILKAVETEDVQNICNKLKEAPEVSIRILRAVNSPYFGLLKEISSIRQAVSLLGVNTLKKLIIMLMLASTNQGPRINNLIEKSVARSYFMEYIAGVIYKEKTIQEKASLMGLLSLADVIMGIPMKELIKELPLDKDIEKALLGENNNLKELLTLCEAMEMGNFRIIDEYSKKTKIDKKLIYDIWLNSLYEYDNFLKNLNI